MMGDNYSLVRKISLVATIVFGIVFCAILWFGFTQYGPLWATAGMFTWIFASVLIWEVIGAVTGIKKTVSTRYKYWLEKHPWLGWGALSMFFLSMLSLVIHLGFVKPKDKEEG